MSRLLKTILWSLFVVVTGWYCFEVGKTVDKMIEVVAAQQSHQWMSEVAEKEKLRGFTPMEFEIKCRPAIPVPVENRVYIPPDPITKIHLTLDICMRHGELRVLDSRISLTPCVQPEGK